MKVSFTVCWNFWARDDAERYTRRVIEATARSVLFEGEPPTDFNQAKPTGSVYLDVILQFLREDFYSPFRAKKRVQFYTRAVLRFVKWKLDDNEAVSEWETMPMSVANIESFRKYDTVGNFLRFTERLSNLQLYDKIVSLRLKS